MQKVQEKQRKELKLEKLEACAAKARRYLPDLYDIQKPKSMEFRALYAKLAGVLTHSSVILPGVCASVLA